MPAAPRLISALRRIRENSPAHDPLICMRQFRRRLPHRHPEGKWLFVTWHLHGSLPQAMYPPPGKPSSSSAFVWMDRYLDAARCGPVYLAQEPIACIVAASLRRGVLLGQYELGAYAIMANHVHVLLLPKISLSRLLQSLKGATARHANLLLGRTGETFWQAESYDHWVRDETEWDRIAAYIEDNPVKAGLVQCAEDYRWSSAGKLSGSAETSLGAAARSGCATTGTQSSSIHAEAEGSNRGTNYKLQLHTRIKPTDDLAGLNWDETLIPPYPRNLTLPWMVAVWRSRGISFAVVESRAKNTSLYFGSGACWTTAATEGVAVAD